MPGTAGKSSPRYRKDTFSIKFVFCLVTYALLIHSAHPVLKRLLGPRNRRYTRVLFEELCLRIYSFVLERAGRVLEEIQKMLHYQVLQKRNCGFNGVGGDLVNGLTCEEADGELSDTDPVGDISHRDRLGISRMLEMGEGP